MYHSTSGILVIPDTSPSGISSPLSSDFWHLSLDICTFPYLLDNQMQMFLFLTLFQKINFTLFYKKLTRVTLHCITWCSICKWSQQIEKLATKYARHTQSEIPSKLNTHNLECYEYVIARSAEIFWLLSLSYSIFRKSFPLKKVSEKFSVEKNFPSSGKNFSEKCQKPKTVPQPD